MTFNKCWIFIKRTFFENQMIFRMILAKFLIIISYFPIMRKEFLNKIFSVCTFQVSSMLSSSFTVAERQAAEEAGRKTGIETVYCSAVPIFD